MDGNSVNYGQSPNFFLNSYNFYFDPLILYSFPPPQMTPQQCKEQGEEPFLVNKGMLPTVVPPTAELECEDGDIPSYTLLSIGRKS